MYAYQQENWVTITQQSGHCPRCSKALIHQPIKKSTGLPATLQESNHFYRKYCKELKQTFGCWHCKHTNHYGVRKTRLCAACGGRCPRSEAPTARSIPTLARVRMQDIQLSWSCPDCGVAGLREEDATCVNKAVY